MNTPTQSQEKAYIALLGLAEHFRTTRNIRKSIQCLEAVNYQSKLQNLSVNQFSSLAFHILAAFEEG